MEVEVEEPFIIDLDTSASEQLNNDIILKVHIYKMEKCIILNTSLTEGQLLT